MKARSETIRTAIKRYNDAAQKLRPPRPTLNPKTVLDYVFLAEFDLLCDACNDVHKQPWARPPECLAAVTCFKICRLQEEKLRVEIEAHWLHMWIHDEEQLFMHVLSCLKTTDRLVAHQVGKLNGEQRIVNDEHRRVLTKLEHQWGYAGICQIGVRLSCMDLRDGVRDQQGDEDEDWETVHRDHKEEDEDDGDDDATADAMDATMEAINRFEI
jgi:hypothetical protein